MTAAVEACIVDAGLGNLRSVQKALERVGLEATISGDPAVVSEANRIVFPGQGGFGDAAVALGGELGRVLRERIGAGVPYLGFCLGLQMLFDASEEAPGARGLGVLGGRVSRFAADLRDGEGRRLKVPHMGWNVLDAPRDPLLDREHFYFAHSYHVEPGDPGIVIATATHGRPFVAAVRTERLSAFQFHPEKSQRAGLAVLARWVSETAGAG